MDDKSPEEGRQKRYPIDLIYGNYLNDIRDWNTKCPFLKGKEEILPFNHSAYDPIVKRENSPAVRRHPPDRGTWHSLLAVLSENISGRSKAVPSNSAYPGIG